MALHGIPDPRGRERHVGVPYPEGLERVDDRVDDGRRRADGGRLADALGADRVMRRRGDRLRRVSQYGHSSAVGSR